MKDFVLGVDPGVSGGIAIWYPKTGDIKLRKFTDEDEFVEMMSQLKGVGFAAIEHVPKYIGNEMRASHSFTLGYNTGFEVGAIKALGIFVDLIRPQKWQRPLAGLKGIAGPKRKRLLRDHAKRLYPGLKPTLATADALLILDYYTKGESR
jgi:hypothetical protein